MTTPVPPNPDSYTLAVTYSINGQEAVNVLGGKINIAGATVEQDDADNWANQWWQNAKQSMTAEVQYVSALMRHLIPNGRTWTPATPGGSLVGAAAGTVAVMNTAAVVKWSTAQGGRRGRGRTFLPGVPAGSIVGSRTLSPTFVSNTNTSMNGYVAGMRGLTTQNVLPAIVSRKFGSSAYILTASVAPVVGTQRERLR
jgi:hypothetical protein